VAIAHFTFQALGLNPLGRSLGLKPRRSSEIVRGFFLAGAGALAPREAVWLGDVGVWRQGWVMVQPSLPAWWQKAERAAHGFNATTHRAKGARHSVYVVILHDPRRTDPWGIYVGQTSRDPDLRFDVAGRVWR
jgi:hypothetical protein